MLDYLHWRGDIAFSVSPWNEVDGALCATLSYLNFHGLEDHRGWTLREAKRIDLLIEGQGNMFGPRKRCSRPWRRRNASARAGCTISSP